MRGFEGVVAIVTGGGMGLGEALCEELERRGAMVVVGDIDEDAAAQVAERLERSGYRRGPSKWTWPTMWTWRS